MAICICIEVDIQRNEIKFLGVPEDASASLVCILAALGRKVDNAWIIPEDRSKELLSELWDLVDRMPGSEASADMLYKLEEDLYFGRRTANRLRQWRSGLG